MAKERIINTKFWSDTYISDLDPIEKFLYLYFLTNEKTNLAGIYELPLKIMSTETGIEISMLRKIITRFEKEKRVFYYKGWVIIKNHLKYQKTENPKIIRGIEIILEDIPAQIRAKAISYGYPMDNLSIDYTYPTDSPSHSNSNSNSNSKNPAAKAASPPKPKKDQNEPMTLLQFVEWCKISKQRHINIIGEWAETVKPDLHTTGQWKTYIKRHLRAAMDLVPFTQDQLDAGYRKMMAEKDWLKRYTLETLTKFLT